MNAGNGGGDKRNSSWRDKYEETAKEGKLNASDGIEIDQVRIMVSVGKSCRDASSGWVMYIPRPRWPREQLRADDGQRTVSSRYEPYDSREDV